MAKRFEVWIVRLEPVLGAEIGKTRPGVIISPDEANDALKTVIVAPLTSVRRTWPTRVAVNFNKTAGDVALDQMRAVDKQRLSKRLGILTQSEAQAVAQRLVQMFVQENEVGFMTEQKLPAGWTIEKLKALSPHERHNVWKKARTSTQKGALDLLKTIEGLGLPYSDSAALKNNDPVTIKMYEIIFSEEGKKACIKATEDGLPAIAGVDKMLNDAFGIDYGASNMATNTAGSIVGELMRELGYQHAGDKKMPAGSVAKTGAFWTR